MFNTGANLFTSGDFISHAGLQRKIECDAIHEEWDCLAQMIMDYQHCRAFKWVEGMPRGGMSLASALQKHADYDADDVGLVVDDVWTTGTSFREYIKEHPTKIHNQIHRWVVFARQTNDGVKHYLLWLNKTLCRTL